MPTLYVVRHGRVASNPVDPDDPELSAEVPGPPPEALPRAEWLRQARELKSKVS